MNIRTLLPGLVFAAATTAAALVAPVSAQNVQESFTGFAINMNNGVRTTAIDLTIERWSTEAERNQLLAIIRENKDPTQPLLRALEKLPPLGRIRAPNTLGWDLRYAYRSKLDGGGRRIVLGTDRPIGFREARNLSRTTDYPFTIIEFHLNTKDEGEGKILAGTKIAIDKNNQLVLENYGQQPVRFNKIKKQK